MSDLNNNSPVNDTGVLNEHNEPNTGGSRQSGRRLAPTSSRTRRNRALAVTGILAVLLVVLGALGFAGYTGYQVLMNNDIYPGVHVGQCDLSGMDRAQARAALESAYGRAALDQVIPITVLDQDYSLPAGACGLSYDIAATVENAYSYGRNVSLLESARMYWSTMADPVQLELRTTLDRELLEARVEEIAAHVEAPMAPSFHRYEDGVLTLDKGQTGYALDREDLLKKLTDKLVTGDFTAPEVVVKESHPQQLSAASIAQAVNRDVVQTALDVQTDPAGNTIKEGTPGIAVSESDLQKAISSPNRHEQVPCTITMPDYTAAEYKALLFRDVLGKCTTDFNPSKVGRTVNVRLATDFCNGVVLMPGDVFSYNDTVGPRTYERGFKDATVYIGTSAEDGVGGGICQVSSTIYYAALRADLKIVERYAHSREVTYVPKGEDATVAWGSKDFRFENNTDFPIRVVTSHNKNTLTVTLYGTSTMNKTVKIETTVLSKTPFEVVYEVDPTLAPGTEKVKSGGYTGYKTESYRVVYIDGVEVSRTKENTSVYKKYDKVIQHNPLPGDPAAPTVPGVTVPPADPGVVIPDEFVPTP